MRRQKFPYTVVLEYPDDDELYTDHVEAYSWQEAVEISQARVASERPAAGLGPGEYRPLLVYPGHIVAIADLHSGPE